LGMGGYPIVPGPHGKSKPLCSQSKKRNCRKKRKGKERGVPRGNGPRSYVKKDKVKENMGHRELHKF